MKATNGDIPSHFGPNKPFEFYKSYTWPVGSVKLR